MKSHNSLRVDQDDSYQAGILGDPFQFLGGDKVKLHQNS